MRRSSRRLLGGVAIACFIGAFALTPSEVRSRLGAPPHDVPVAAATAAATPGADVPRDDPFVPRAVDVDALLVRATAASRTPQPIAGRAHVERARLLAVVIGTRAEALVDDAGTTRAIGVGDRVEGATVVAIGDGEVRFDDGRRIALTRAGVNP